mmetsp:Transcript_62943/g.168106  ORF Transcript_62943/g.168106 Transcript_62943/m.168106 type:complete len:337 (+) Transcript_62943:35-1045(+)
MSLTGKQQTVAAARLHYNARKQISPSSTTVQWQRRGRTRHPPSSAIRGPICSYRAAPGGPRDVVRRRRARRGEAPEADLRITRAFQADLGSDRACGVRLRFVDNHGLGVHLVEHTVLRLWEARRGCWSRRCWRRGRGSPARWRAGLGQDKLVAFDSKLLGDRGVVAFGLPVESSERWFLQNKLQSRLGLAVISSDAQGSPIGCHFNQVICATHHLSLLKDVRYVPCRSVHRVLAARRSTGRPAALRSVLPSALGPLLLGYAGEGHKLAGASSSTPQRHWVLRAVLQVAQIAAVCFLPLDVVVNGLRLLDPSQDCLVVPGDAQKLFLPRIAVQAVGT